MITEFFIGYVMSRSCLFYPEFPGDSEPLHRKVFLMGYMLKEGPTREEPSKTFGVNGRLTKMMRFLAGLMVHDAYIGRLL